MHHFFVQPGQIHENEIWIEGTDVNHIRNVLRMKEGECIQVTAGNEWEYTCRIISLSGKGQAVSRSGETDVIRTEIVDAQKPGKELPSRIYLFQCLPKSDKMEIVVQKSVELGAFRVIPVRSKRSVVRLDNKKAEARVKRWNAIAESAAKQSRRMIIPEVEPVVSLEEALRRISGEEIPVRLFPYEMESASPMEETRKILSALNPGQDIAVLIGPEGGFDTSEADAAVKAGFQKISLGRRILRTETAGPALLSILTYLLEE